MSILISPSDNTGWGLGYRCGLGNRLMRSTGLVRTARQPVSVRHYYRSREHRRPTETIIVSNPRRRRRTVTRTVRVRTAPRRRIRRTTTLVV